MLESTAVTKKRLIGIARRTGVPAFQFHSHRAQEGELRQVRDGGSFSDCPDETPYSTALGRLPVPVAEPDVAD
jgi:hypothetical protein